MIKEQWRICGLTKPLQDASRRAADAGYAPRFLSIFLALGSFHFGGESTHPPQLTRAVRWLGLILNCYLYYDLCIETAKDY